MQTGTPKHGAPTTARSDRRIIRAAIRAIDARWAAAPLDLHPGEELTRLIAPLFACAARIEEPGVASHMLRVGRIAAGIAEAVGWDSLRAAELRILGGLHDLGKLGIGAAILTKPGALSTEERRCVEAHASAGFQLLARARAPLLRAAARVARDHHEWWNGSGYPSGRAGAAIDLNARVVAVADVYDALTSPRPYRAALPRAHALGLMRAGRGTQFDPHLLDAFLDTASDITASLACDLAA